MSRIPFILIYTSERQHASTFFRGQILVDHASLVLKKRVFDVEKTSSIENVNLLRKALEFELNNSYI